MNRRDFLKFTTAALLASQLPDLGRSAAAITSRKEPMFTDKGYIRPGIYAGSSMHKAVRRHVLFVQEGAPREGITPEIPVGTVVSSPDERFAFIVVEHEKVAEVIPYVTSQWDEQEHGKKAGQNCAGVAVIVEAVAPGEEYATCPIRRNVGRNFGYDHICEAHLDRCYYPVDEHNHLQSPYPHYFAHDAVYPPETQPASWQRSA